MDIRRSFVPKGLLQKLLQSRTTQTKRRQRYHTTWPLNPQYPVLHSGHRALHGHGHLQGFHGGILQHCKIGDKHMNLPHLMSQHSFWTQGRTQAQGDLLLRRKSDGAECFFISGLTIGDWQFEWRVYTHTLPRALFSAFFCFQTHLDALRTLSAFTVQGRIVKVIPSSHHSLTCSSATETTSTSTTWLSCGLVFHSQNVWVFIPQCPAV